MATFLVNGNYRETTELPVIRDPITGFPGVSGPALELPKVWWPTAAKATTGRRLPLVYQTVKLPITIIYFTNEVRT